MKEKLHLPFGRDRSILSIDLKIIIDVNIYSILSDMI